MAPQGSFTHLNGLPRRHISRRPRCDEMSLVQMEAPSIREAIGGIVARFTLSGVSRHEESGERSCLGAPPASEPETSRHATPSRRPAGYAACADDARRQ